MITNILCVLFSLVAIFFTWKVYTLTKAKGILWLLFSFIYAAMLRFLMTCNVISGPVAMPIFLGSYILMAAGAYFLYMAIRKIIK
jgi:hypothetical protein